MKKKNFKVKNLCKLSNQLCKLHRLQIARKYRLNLAPERKAIVNLT